MNNFWGEFDINSGDIAKRELGPLRVWFKRTYNEIWIATQYKVIDAFSDDTQNLTWIRWIVGEKDFHLKLSPVVADKPIIICPEYSFKILKKAEARVFTRIPLWVRIALISSSEQILVEIPTIVLSKTWFGDPTSGELCYWSTTVARREIKENYFKDFMAICTLNIHNQSESDLQVEKICYRVERLTLFEKDDHIWTDESEITYRGNEQHSDVVMTGILPMEARGGKKIGNPRSPVRKSIATRTFEILRDLPLFGD